MSTSNLSQEDIGVCLFVLESAESTLEEKRTAFSLMKETFAPVINRSPAFADELRTVFSLRFNPWPLPSSHVIQNPVEVADRIRGLVFGAALGDAVGLSTEFMSRQQVQACYPAGHVFRPSAEPYPDLHRVNFPQGDWTDDTDQLVLILQTLLENQGQFHGPMFAQKLLSWKRHGFPGLGDDGGAGCGRTTVAVMSHKDFLTDPRVAAADVWERSGRRAAPNGGVMRTAITGVPFFWDKDMVQHNTLGFCKATHADPRCAVSCLVISELVRLTLLEGSRANGEDGKLAVQHLEDQVRRAIATSIEKVPELGSTGMQELEWHANITTLESLQLDDPEKIGYTYKCFGSGVWALRTAIAKVHSQKIHPRAVMEQVLQDLVRAGGDADTNGAVAGALLGAQFGCKNLPWLGDLPYGGWLEAWVQKLLFMMGLPVASN